MTQKTVLASAMMVLSVGVAFANGGTPPPQPIHHGDLYVGFGVSRDDAWLNGALPLVDKTVDGVDAKDNRHGDMGAEGWDAHLALGYGMLFNQHYYLAAELFGSISSLQGDLVKANYQEFLPNVSLQQRQWVDIPYTVGIALVPGYVVAPGSTFLGRIGYVNSKFKIKGTRVDSPANPLGHPLPVFSKNKGGLQLGFGVETEISNHIGIREGYTWNHYGSISGTATAGPNAAGTVRTRTVTIDPDVESFNLTAIYHFHPIGEFDHNVPVAHSGQQFYAGITGSRDTAFFDYRQHLQIFQQTKTSNTLIFNAPVEEGFSFKGRGWSGEILGGVGETFQNRLYFGAEIFGSLSSLDSQIDLPATEFTPSTGAVTSQFHQQWKFEMAHSYGAALLAGYQVSNSALLYARAGFVESEFKFKSTLSDSPVTYPNEVATRANFNKNEAGLQFGLGVDTLLYNHFTLRTEFDWTDYGCFNSPVKTVNGTFDSDPRIFTSKVQHFIDHLVTDQFKVSLIDHFYSA